MIRKLIHPWALAVTLLMPRALSEAEAAGPAVRVRLDDPQAPDKNRFGFSYRSTFNIRADFQNVGATPSTASARGPGGAVAGVDHFYDDGYVRVDSTHSGGGLTWFWGYKNESQVNQQEDTLEMHSTSVLPLSSKAGAHDAHHGMEITYNRELGRSDKRGWNWGLEAAMGWTDVDIKDNRTLTGGLRITTDSYNLGGIDPHQQPFSAEYPGHAGTREGPGPLIDDKPSRSVNFTSSGGMVSGRRDFVADLFTFRFGPYMEIPIKERLIFSLSAGAALGVVDGRFSFSQQVTTPAGFSFQRGSGGDTDVVFGGFVSATLRYTINPKWSVLISGQYMGLSSYSAKAGGQKVELDFAATGSGSIGLTYSF